MNIIDTYSKNLLSKRNVVAVASGQKWIKGRNTGRDALLVFVKQKEYKEKLSRNDLIPSSIDGLETDVVGKSGEFGIHSFTAKQRPVQPGISCGHLQVTAGTIGGFFVDREGSIVGLSNNHVIAAENVGRRGDSIVQPGPYDANPNGNAIGALKYYRTLAKSNQYSYDAHSGKRIYGYNLEDSGIFQVSSESIVDSMIKGIGYLNDFRDTINIGEQVQKSGRTTEVTTGNVIGLNATVNVNYGSYSLQFRDQIITNGMSQGGDSGSLLLDMNKNVVGLLFAGSNTMTIHNRIIYPRATYGLSIYNQIKLVESLQIVLKINGVITPNTYKEADFNKALSDAKAIAKQGSLVEIITSYSVQPE